MNKFLFAFVFMNAILCSAESEKMLYFNRLHKCLAQNISSKYGLALAMTGGSVPNMIQTFDFGFESKKKMEFGEVRHLIINIIKECIVISNNSEVIQKFLANYPLDENNFEVMILFFEADKNRVKPPYVAHVSVSNGRISYRYTSEYDGKLISKLDFVETYQEALKIVQDESNSG